MLGEGGPVPTDNLSTVPDTSFKVAQQNSWSPLHRER